MSMMPVPGAAAGYRGALTTVGSLADVQRALTALGVASLPDTGTLDHATQQAIMAFQRGQMLPPTGKPDQPTRERIAVALGQIGFAAFAPAFTTGALADAPIPIVDRSAQIREQALRALQELRDIGVEAVSQSLRHVIGDPTLTTLRSVVAFLAQPTSGIFANTVAKLWGPVAEAYAKQADPNAALAPAVDIQMKPLLQQLDTVLGAINQLAATPTVDQLHATVGMLSQPQAGSLGPKLAQQLHLVLAVLTAPPAGST